MLAESKLFVIQNQDDLIISKHSTATAAARQFISFSFYNTDDEHVVHVVCCHIVSH